MFNFEIHKIVGFFLFAIRCSALYQRVMRFYVVTCMRLVSAIANRCKPLAILRTFHKRSGKPGLLNGAVRQEFNVQFVRGGMDVQR